MRKRQYWLEHEKYLKIIKNPTLKENAINTRALRNSKKDGPKIYIQIGDGGFNRIVIRAVCV